MKLVFKIYFWFLLLIPVTFLILPKDFFDSGQSLCLSKWLFNLECLGCGITRAIQHLIHFNFKVAYEFNKLSIIVLPTLVFVWFNELKRVLKIL